MTGGGPPLDESPFAYPNELFAKHAAWWEGRARLVSHPYEPALAALWLPLADGSIAESDIDLTPESLDLDRLAAPPPESLTTAVGGDLVPARLPYVRLPWLEAIAGCQIRALIQAGSMRTRPVLSSWEELATLPGRRNDGWLHALLDLVQRIVATTTEGEAVGHTLMRGPADIAEAMVGAERLCLAVYDQPEALSTLLAYTTELFEEAWREQAARIPRLDGGSVNWYGIWAPGTTVRTQCDASALTSPELYAARFAPWDLRTAQVAEYSIMHLHSGSLHVIDTLLEGPHPTALQVSLDPPPSAPHWRELLPTFSKMLDHKPLLVDGFLSTEEVDAIWEALPQNGLAVIGRRAQPD